MAAGLATLDVILGDAEFYTRLETLGAALEAGLIQAAARVGSPCTVARVGSMWTLFFAAERVDDWTSAARADTTRFARFFQAMLARGVFLAPSQFEANFISAAHTEQDIDATVHAIADALQAM